MLCITDAYGIMNAKQAHTSLHTSSFVAPLQYFLLQHFNRIQAFEAAGKLVQTREYPECASCQSD